MSCDFVLSWLPRSWHTFCISDNITISSAHLFFPQEWSFDRRLVIKHTTPQQHLFFIFVPVGRKVLR